MGYKKKLKDLLLKCDIFATSEFLRYNDEPQYRTFTGAACSIVTVVTFCAIFMSDMISTFQRTEIIWSLNTIDVPIDEFNVTAAIEGKNKFMFAVQISGQDLNNETNKKFDVKFALRKRLNTTVEPNQQIITLQKCTPQHWNVNEQIMKTYYRMKFSEMLCPPIGQQIPMQGKFTSQFFEYAQIQIYKCTPTAQNSTKSCSNQPIPANKTFHFSIYILNTLLNPDSADYITYYLQDRNFIIFTTEFSSLVSIFISSYEITSDQSIIPLKKEFVETGAMINSLGQVMPYRIDGGPYASFVFRRASTTTVVNRSYRRVDQTFSYIGGLFGFVLIVLLFMKEYTEYSFQMDASSHLYHQDPEKPIESHRFNLLIFMGYIFYLLLQAFGIETNWKQMKEMDDCRQQIQKQLDVRFLFQRINFLEKAIKHLFSQEQTKFLHLQRKLTLKQASELREKYRSKRTILKNVGDRQIEISQNHSDNTSQNVQLQPQIQFGSKFFADNLIANQTNQENELVSQPKNGKTLKGIKDNFKRLHRDGHHVSKKIIEDLDPRIVKIINKPHPLYEPESQKNQQSSQKLQVSHRNNLQQQNLVYQTRFTAENNTKTNRFQQNWEQTHQRQRDVEQTFDFIN